MNRGIFAAFLSFGALATAQLPPDIKAPITQFLHRLKIAVPDLRGSGASQALMPAFNATLWSDLASSGAVDMVGKSYYPTIIPQRPEDFKRGGAWITDWSGAPTSANDLAFGFGDEQNGQFVVRGWLFNLSQPDPASAQVFGKLYFGALTADGAKKAAHDF